ncbi:MAG: PAS domain S-box protein [Phycisphaerales bacterium]|nr:PAS domain S-box protein [Phycisphaerales bacterium]
MPASPIDDRAARRRPGGWIQPGMAALLGGAAAAAAAAAGLHWQLAVATGAAALAAATIATRAANRRTLATVAAAPATDTAHEREAAYWQAIVATMTEGCVTIDVRGTIESINEAALRLFGYTRAELLGKNVKMLMPAPYGAEHDGYLGRYLKTGERRVIGIGREVVGRRKDGSEFPIDLSVGEGWLGGQRFFTAVLRDISERKELQTKLAQSERLAAVGELAAGVAHEVNNPLNTIINCAQLIHDGDDANANATVIAEEGQRIAEIVRDLLQFARDDKGRLQPTSLAEVTGRTLRLLGDNWNRHGIKVVVELPDDLPPALARPQQLQQVLLNLLMNAKDALAEGARPDRTIWLRGRAQGDRVCLAVRDNGPGVPAHLGVRVFEPFVTTKRARGGTGLGLSVSKGIVESAGGALELHNRPGEGAEFVVNLPRAEADPLTPA